MIILGISAFYHDAAAVLIKDGMILAAAQEERFTRKKHDFSYPKFSIQFCLKQAGLTPAQVDFVVFYEKPFLKFERLLETYLAFAPLGIRSFLKSMPVWVREKLFQKESLKKELKKLDESFDWEQKLLFSEHHLSHAASAFYPSPFEEAIVLTMDGVGEWTTTSVAIGSGNKLDIKKEIHFPHSLGLLYSAFTYYTGFKVNSGEYKVMGLAPYGKPVYADLIKKHLIDIKEDGSFRMNMDYFNYCAGLTMTNAKFHRLFGGPPREAESPLTQRDMDLAASVQQVTEEVVLKLARSLRKEFDIPNLCLAGGVALNCVANGKVLSEGIYDNIWIQPAAGDAGGALGAALAAYHLHFSKPRSLQPQKKDGLEGSYLGPEFSQKDIEQKLQGIGAVFETFDEKSMLRQSAEALIQGKVVGWFQGRMEFGPRALGARSILGHPGLTDMQSQLNLKIKYRESFRPFAPAVLEEKASEWFSLDQSSPYMLLVAPVCEGKRLKHSEDESLFGIEKLKESRSLIPAVTHVDYSARIQTVSSETHPIFHQLIREFHQMGGPPVLINTSFNVRGEPIVCTPEDAFRCFMGTEMDVLVIGRSFLEKKKQDSKLLEGYHQKYDLD